MEKSLKVQLLFPFRAKRRAKKNTGGRKNIVLEWFLIFVLVWAGVMWALYQVKVYERFWGMEEVEIPQHFYRFFEILAAIFGVTSLWNLIKIPTLNGNGNNKKQT